MTPDRGLQIEGEVLLPLTAHGVKMMSMGFINPGTMPLRGAKARPRYFYTRTRTILSYTDRRFTTCDRGAFLQVIPVVQQLLGRTAWGDLDYLIVDMPPGTGDVQLTLAVLNECTATSAWVGVPPKSHNTDDSLESSPRLAPRKVMRVPPRVGPLPTHRGLPARQLGAGPPPPPPRPCSRRV